MISLFILGAIIGSGACLIIDQSAQIKILKEDNLKLKKENENYFVKYERDNNEDICSDNNND